MSIKTKGILLAGHGGPPRGDSSATPKPEAMGTFRQANEGRFVLAAAAAVLLLASTACCEAPPVIVGSYPIPVSETGEFLADWLRQAGFTVTVAIPEAGKAGLRAKRQGQTLRIEIGPKSPLISVVAVSGTPDNSTLDGLRAGLERHLSGLHPDSGLPDGGTRLRVPDRVRSREDAVLCLKTNVKGETYTFSGFVIDQQGFIITTAHNLEGAGVISGNDGRHAGLAGELVKRDAQRDLTLVRTATNLKQSVPLQDARRQLREGDLVWAIGCPGNRGRRILSGIVDRPPAMVGGQPLWQVDMDIAPGSSGGAAFDAEGRLVGVVKGRFRGEERRGFLIPLDTLREFLEPGTK